jgi:hypothetical protein
VGLHGADGARDGKTVVQLPPQEELFFGIRPRVAIEVGKGNAAPMEVRSADAVAIDLDVHDDSMRQLDLSDAAQLNVIAEAG